MKIYRFIFVIVTLCFLACLAWSVYLFFLPIKTTTGNYLFNVAVSFFFLVGGMLAWFYIYRCKLTCVFGKAMLWIGGAQISYAIAGFFWAYYNLILHIDIPYPSLADVFYLLFPLGVALGSLHLMEMAHVRITHQGIRDSSIVIITTYICVFFLFYQPDLSSNLPWQTVVFNLFYPLTDALLISLAFILIRVIRGSFLIPSLFLTMSLIVMSVGDMLFSYRNTHGLYWNGDISDVLFLVSGYLMMSAIFLLVQTAEQISKKRQITT